MAFVKTTWAQGQLPEISAAQLNRIETGIADAHIGDTLRAYGVWYPDITENGGVYVRFGQSGKGAPATHITRNADLRGFTIVKAGTYMVSFALLFGNGGLADARYDLNLRINGVEHLNIMERPQAGYLHYVCTDVWEYAAGDSIGLWWPSNATGAYTDAARTWGRFQITHLGTAL